MANRAREGYVMIDRNILDWKWWQKHNTLIVFLWLLLKANFHESFFGGIKIERGQVATSIENICNHNKLTRQEVKTALEHLKTTGEITTTRHSSFLVITIVNYSDYQNSAIKSNIHQTSCKHQSNINQTHPNNDNNTKNNKNEKKKGRYAPNPPVGVSDVPYASTMKPIDEGTVDDIPEEYRDFCPTYADYWRFRNR